MSLEEAAGWRDLPQDQKLNEPYRSKFLAAGYEFGHSIINVIRCPACPADAQPNHERVALKAALEELLGDDEDGLAAMFEDYGW